ncbi:hypothetical protein NKH98_32550 [Mesorhizobium sp. M0833]|uniref:hypothetical protein n=1 Tax=Mesorhizobium sp. M0833 TaxID=2957009 RepID=UPI00333A3D64
MNDELIRLPGAIEPATRQGVQHHRCEHFDCARMPDGDLLGLGSHLIVTPIEFATKMALEKQAA